MKNMFKYTALAVIFLTTLFGQDKKAFDIDNSGIALQGYSHVSYVDLGLAQKGVKEFKSDYNKVIFYSTSKKQGIYIDAKLRPAPNKFIVKDRKYFLFHYNLELDAQELWLSENNRYGLVKTADKKWEKLKKDLQLKHTLNPSNGSSALSGPFLFPSMISVAFESEK